MAAASFTPSGMPADLSQAVSISTLGTAGIAAVTFVVLGLALLTSWVDRRFAAQTLELQEEKLQRSEAYLAEAQRLTHTGSWAWRLAGSSTDITERKQAEEALRQAQTDLAHASRVTTMGELTASLAHEVNQPIAAAITDANTCLRWLTRDQPDMEEARVAASRMAKDATRAADIISRIRLLFRKVSPQPELVDVNEVIREMIVLLLSEVTR